eukprot:TRINITY_DN107957_c0_g1_i1.p1 TRINITY_DN107957_c0_g1~~TRINITY_DN107957_c0_g1_i1.p1  ORF type:complete len:463 (+),score=71.33 TRINITY_DN107957_c0_g1_i1:46-1434(+)
MTGTSMPTLTAALCILLGGLTSEAAVAAEAPKWGFRFHEGFIPDEFNIETQRMLPEAAAKRCVSLPGCEGFSVEGAPNSKKRTTVVFKSKWELLPNRPPGYGSFQRVPIDLSAQAGARVLEEGEVLVVDGFLQGEDLARIGRLIENARVEKAIPLVLNASKTQFRPSAEDMPFVFDLVDRIYSYAEKNVYPAPGITDFFPFTGKYFADEWTLRRYTSGNPEHRQVSAHTDTEQPGRCLSATLHLGDETDTEGGVLQTFECPAGINCRRLFRQEAYNFEGEEHRMKVTGSAPYKYGRLVFFLASTPHAVTELVKGPRDILFIWLSCYPTLRSAINGNVTLVKQLLEDGAAVNTGLSTGFTALHQVVAYGHQPVAQLLLENRADVTARDFRGGRTPLYSAAEKGHGDLIKELAARGADVCQSNNKGESPLHEANRNGHKSAVEALVALGGKGCKKQKRSKKSEL